MISVIIPHAGGSEMLRECISSLASSTGVEIELIVVDNGSGETAGDWGIDKLTHVQILQYPRKMGFAPACNRGVEAATGDYAFLLNNDAVVEPDAIRLMAEKLDSDAKVCAVVPKILSYFNPGQFDYSSAAGGHLDCYGIPFARGRLFDKIEHDTGQYDKPDRVFWGAGAALMIRRAHWIEAGGLEEPFFAHMEEIDLLWRMQLMDNIVMTVPQAVVRHRGAVTIQSGSFLKIYLNSRNSVLMLLRNYSTHNLFRFVPARMMMDFGFAFISLVKFNFIHFWAIIRAWLWIISSLDYIFKCRKTVRGLRKVKDDVILSRVYCGSIAWAYFIRKISRYSDLMA